MNTLVFHVVVGDPKTDAARECPNCGFDALLDFPLYGITAEGIGQFGTFHACARCYEERSR